MHTAPGAHISVDGRTFFWAVHPVCARFFNEILWLYYRGVHGQAAGCTLYEPVRPDGAHNKTLISNTGRAALSNTLLVIVGETKVVEVGLHLTSCTKFLSLRGRILFFGNECFVVQTHVCRLEVIILDKEGNTKTTREFYRPDASLPTFLTDWLSCDTSDHETLRSEYRFTSLIIPWSVIRGVHYTYGTYWGVRRSRSDDLRCKER